MSACTDPCGGYQATGIPTATDPQHLKQQAAWAPLAESPFHPGDHHPWRLANRPLETLGIEGEYPPKRSDHCGLQTRKSPVRPYSPSHDRRKL